MFVILDMGSANNKCFDLEMLRKYKHKIKVNYDATAVLETKQLVEN